MNTTNARAYLCSASRLRPQLLSRGLSAALLFALSASVWAQTLPLPILTWQQPPTNPGVYQISGYGGVGPFNVFSYSVQSGSPAWYAESTVIWRNVNARVNTNPASGMVPPNPAPGQGQRLGYSFYVDQNECPTWDCCCPNPPLPCCGNRPPTHPRAEFDSAVSGVANAPRPDPPNLPPYTWDNDGIVDTLTPPKEQIFLWSMYLDANPLSSTDSRAWCDLNQLHPGGPGYAPYYNWYPAPPCGGVDCNTWPVVAANNNPLDRLFFHTNRVNDNCDGGLDCRNVEPPRLWDIPLSPNTHQWFDFAMYARWSTGPDGLLIFYVGGNEVSRQTGSNFYSSNPVYNYAPFYYFKQGYYRNRIIVPGVTVYMTPMLVTTSVQTQSPIRR
jgi:hypothetical protein